MWQNVKLGNQILWWPLKTNELTDIHFRDISNRWQDWTMTQAVLHEHFFFNRERETDRQTKETDRDGEKEWGRQRQLQGLILGHYQPGLPLQNHVPHMRPETLCALHTPAKKRTSKLKQKILFDTHRQDYVSSSSGFQVVLQDISPL